MYPYSAIIPTVEPANDRKQFDHSNDMADKIIETVRVYYGLKNGFHKSKSRETTAVSAKQAVRYLLTTVADMGPTEIARLTGFHHTTVIVSLQSVYGFIRFGDRLSEDIKNIQAKL